MKRWSAIVAVLLSLLLSNVCGIGRSSAQLPRRRTGQQSPVVPTPSTTPRVATPQTFSAYAQSARRQTVQELVAPFMPVARCGIEGINDEFARRRCGESERALNSAWQGHRLVVQTGDWFIASSISDLIYDLDLERITFPGAPHVFQERAQEINLAPVTLPLTASQYAAIVSSAEYGVGGVPFDGDYVVEWESTSRSEDGGIRIERFRILAVRVQAGPGGLVESVALPADRGDISAIPTHALPRSSADFDSMVAAAQSGIDLPATNACTGDIRRQISCARSLAVAWSTPRFVARMMVRLGEYDFARQEFPVQIGTNQQQLEWSGRVRVPVAEAEDFLHEHMQDGSRLCAQAIFVFEGIPVSGSIFAEFQRRRPEVSELLRRIRPRVIGVRIFSPRTGDVILSQPAGGSGTRVPVSQQNISCR